MSLTAVVILNWNGVAFLKRFLPGIVEHTTLPGSRVIIADNDSEDDSVRWVRDHYPDVKVIVLKKNHGFAGGYNLALKQVDADYYVLLNSDVEVRAGWLEPLISFMDHHPETGACMPKIKSLKDPCYFEYAGAAGGFIDKYGYPFCRGRLFNITEKDEGQYDLDLPVFWASGACYVIRAKLYHQAGGLDPDFFAHMEEIDLSWRLQCLGYKIYALSGSEVFHLGGGSLNMNNPRKTFLNFRNNLYLLVKNLPPHLLWKMIPARFILDGIAGLKFLAGLEFGNFLAVIKAHFSFYFHCGTMLRKRQKEPRCKDLPVTVYPHSLIWQFFIRGKRFFGELQK